MRPKKIKTVTSTTANEMKSRKAPSKMTSIAAPKMPSSNAMRITASGPDFAK